MDRPKRETKWNVSLSGFGLTLEVERHRMRAFTPEDKGDDMADPSKFNFAMNLRSMARRLIGDKSRYLNPQEAACVNQCVALINGMGDGMSHLVDFPHGDELMVDFKAFDQEHIG